MTLVIDTSVMAAALMGDSSSAPVLASRALLERGDSICVPDLFFAEFANVACKHVRAGLVSHAVAVGLMRSASRLITHVVANVALWERALELAVVHHPPAYDMVFVALAEVHDTTLVTLDRRLHRCFPERTRMP